MVYKEEDTLSNPPIGIVRRDLASNIRMSNLPANCVPSTLQKLRPWVYTLAIEDWRLLAEGQKCRGIRERKLAAWLRQQARLNVHASVHMQRQCKAQMKDIVKVLFAT